MSSEIETQPSGGDDKGQAAAATDAGQTKPATHNDTLVEESEGTAEYAQIGSEFTRWFNAQVQQLPNASIRLGTKTAHVVQLHPDGRLECKVEGEGSKNEQQFVVFEAQHLDQLLRRITAISV